MCTPAQLAMTSFWLVWSIVWHYEQKGLSGTFEEYLQKLAPNRDWAFLRARHRKSSLKCLENQRQKEMAAGGSTKMLGKGGSGKRKKEDNWNGQEDKRRHKGGHGKSKKEDNAKLEQDNMKKGNDAVGKNTNNEEETEQEKREKMRQLVLRAALARGGARRD